MKNTVNMPTGNWLLSGFLFMKKEVSPRQKRPIIGSFFLNLSCCFNLLFNVIYMPATDYDGNPLIPPIKALNLRSTLNSRAGATAWKAPGTYGEELNSVALRWELGWGRAASAYISAGRGHCSFAESSLPQNRQVGATSKSPSSFFLIFLT